MDSSPEIARRPIGLVALVSDALTTERARMELLLVSREHFESCSNLASDLIDYISNYSVYIYFETGSLFTFFALDSACECERGVHSRG